MIPTRFGGSVNAQGYTHTRDDSQKGIQLELDTCRCYARVANCAFAALTDALEEVMSLL